MTKSYFAITIGAKFDPKYVVKMMHLNVSWISLRHKFTLRETQVSEDAYSSNFTGWRAEVCVNK